MGRSRFAQRKAAVHHRFQLAGEDVLHHLMEFALRAHERSQERKLAGKEETQIERGFRTGGGAAGHDLASRLDRLHAFDPCGLAHMLKNNVTHGLVGESFHLFGDFLLVVVDGEVGAEFAALVHLALVARGGDGNSAEHLAELDGRRADSRPPAQNQHGVSRLEGAPRYQHVPGSQKYEGHGCRLVISQFALDRQNIDARHADELGVTAVIQISKHAVLRTKVLLAPRACRAYPAKCMWRQEHALPDFQIRNILSHLGNHAGNVAAVDVRQLDARQSLADKQVQVVQRTSLYPNQDLVFPGTRIGNVFVLEDFWTAELVEA